MKTIAAFIAVASLAGQSAHAESWPKIERLGADAAFVVHCRVAKSDDSGTQFAVVEAWKGAYSREAFATLPPQGFILTGDKATPANSQVVLVYLTSSRAAGKFQRPDMAVPVADGKITYPGGTAEPGQQKQYTLAAFKAQIQSAVRFPLVNGDFEASPVGSEPDGWKAAYPTGGGVVASDGKDTFVRLSSGQAQNAGIAQDVPVPEKATRIAVLGRMRGKPKHEKDEKRAAVEVALRFQDAKGGMISAAVVASGNSTGWRTFRRDFAVPPGCTKVEVVARSIFAIGTFDFDEVRVEFK